MSFSHHIAEGMCPCCSGVVSCVLGFGEWAHGSTVATCNSCKMISSYQVVGGLLVYDPTAEFAFIEPDNP